MKDPAKTQDGKLIVREAICKKSRYGKIYAMTPDNRCFVKDLMTNELKEVLPQSYPVKETFKISNWMLDWFGFHEQDDSMTTKVITAIREKMDHGYTKGELKKHIPSLDRLLYYNGNVTPEKGNEILSILDGLKDRY